MDSDSCKALSKVLGKREIEKIPHEILKKIEKFCEARHEEFMTTKMLYSTTQKNIEKLRKDYEKVTTKTQDTEVKIEAAEVNVNELRHQLERAHSEVVRLTTQVEQHESETSSYRKERNDIMDERDQLQKSLDKTNALLKRLQSDMKLLESKLESAISDKVAVVDELTERTMKEQSLELKERKIEQEKELLTNEIMKLKEKLNKNVIELTALRQEKSSGSNQWESKLEEKTEELRIVNEKLFHLTEMNRLLTIQSEENTLKLTQQVNESARLVSYYQKELECKVKLADLYQENSNDYQIQVNNLTVAMNELQQNLDKSAHEYALLEAKLEDFEKQHQINLEQKDEMITHLQQELQSVNDLLKIVKTETSESILEKFAPSAAAANRLLKGNLSLTQIYTRYYDAIDATQNKEDECIQFKIELEQLQSELQEKNPEFERQKVECTKMLTLNEELTQKLDNCIAERDRCQAQVEEIRSKFEYLQRENATLKSSQSDLARQICYLLNEKQVSQDATSPESKALGIPTQQAIAKKLVTFDNIVEMQENNQKLLVKVRDLSTKIEKLVETQNHVNSQCYEEKLSSLEGSLQEAEEARRANEELLDLCMKQKERFKELYYQAVKDYCTKPTAQSTEGGKGDVDVTTVTKISKNDNQDKRALDLDKILQNKIKELKELKEEYNEYRKESSINFKLLNDQYDVMQNKVEESISTNCQLTAEASFANERIKTYETDIIIYKKQIQTLEERNQMYDKTILKHETTIKQLRDEALNIMKKATVVENRCEYLESECRRLINANSNLEVEHQALHRQKLTQSILQSNLEIIKVASERSQFEGQIQMEQKLDEATRQCAALKQKSEEEQNRFRDDVTSLKRQADSAVMKMKDEQAQTEMLKSKITETRAQIESKNHQINDLSKKLQEALTPCKFDNPIAKANKKIKDLELQVKNKATEIEKLQNELKATVTKGTQLSKQVSDLESQSKVEKEKFDHLRAKLMADLQASQLNETNLKSQVEELQIEIRLQITGSHSKADAATQSKVQNELKEALLKLSKNNKELRDLRHDCQKLKMNLETVELKYSNEMQVHASDLQALNTCKDDLNKSQSQINQLREAEQKAKEMMKASQSECEISIEKANKDRLELEQRIQVLIGQNNALHDLLQAQHNQDASVNDSMTNISFLNQTLTDDAVKDISSEKLLSVFKYLRREKEIFATRVEILKSENTRLSNEYEWQNKRLDELTQQLNASKLPINETKNLDSSQYNDLKRKVETMNALTDSNILLREERNNLLIKVNDLTEKVTKLEAELFPMQEKFRELSSKDVEQTEINNMLRTNVDHLRKRVQDLMEQENKNPEDFKRLQTERENLAKMLTTEKENQRKLNEELNLMNREKTRLEQELGTINKQLHASIDEKKKIQDELNNSKQTINRLTHEINEVRNNIVKKDIEVKTIQAELTSKNSQLTDIKSKEIQIRKIAKKYKDSYTDLKAKEDERDAGKSTSTNALSTNRNVAEGDVSKKLQELSAQLASCQEENLKLSKENENLKKQDEKNFPSEARSRIATLTEANRLMNRDNQSLKTQLQSCEQSRSGHDSVVVALKSQLDAKVKELSDLETSKQETVARLTRDNETLNTRVNQLQRQFQQQGSKPSTSSGTIEKSPSDPARTANVKPMATPTPQQSATVNPRRGADTPLASIRPMSVQNSRTAAVLPTSQTSNIAAVQGSSTGIVTTALVPPQQQVHTTGNSSTAEAMSSSPTSSHTDYMPATSSAVVVAVPPMGSTSAESTQEAESLSVNTNESSSSSSSTSSQAVVQQQQAVALVSPRVEVAPQNALAPSQQVADQNQAASTSGSSSSFLTTMSSHHQASSSNTVTTTQAGGHKRPRDAEGDSSTGVEESSASEKTSPQTKRTRLGEQTFQGVSESGLDVEYQVPTSSQRDQEDDVIAVDSDDEDDDVMDDEATADVDEAFDADEIESFGQDEGEGHDIDEDNVRNDTNEVDVDDGSNAPNQSSSGIAASSGVRTNSNEAIEPSPLSQETQQIQMISSGSDAGPSGQGNNWRQAQAPARQQQNLIIQQAYEETGDDSIVPSTPTLYVARRADGFSEAVSSPHPIVPHASRFTFNDSGANRVPAATIGSVIEGMDDTRIDLNLLNESGEGGQSSSVVPANAVDDSDNQPIVSVDAAKNKEAAQKEPVAGPSGQEGKVSEIMDTENKNERNAIDDNASTSQVVENKNVSNEMHVEDGDVGTDGVSSEGEKSSGPDGIQVEEGREAEAASIVPVDNAQLRNTRSRRVFRGRENNQRPAPLMHEGRHHQMYLHHQQQHPHQHQYQQHGNHRGSLNRGSNRGNRGRSRRPYR